MVVADPDKGPFVPGEHTLKSREGDCVCSSIIVHNVDKECTSPDPEMGTEWPALESTILDDWAITDTILLNPGVDCEGLEMKYVTVVGDLDEGVGSTREVVSWLL
jgi:hypothetical protein